MRLGVLVRVSTFSQARALVAADPQAYSERRTLALIGSVADDESQERDQQSVRRLGLRGARVVGGRRHTTGPLLR